MGRVSGVRCDGCHRVKTALGNWSGVWARLKGEGWTVDRGKHRCPICSEAWKKKLDEEARL